MNHRETNIGLLVYEQDTFERRRDSQIHKLTQLTMNIKRIFLAVTIMLLILTCVRLPFLRVKLKSAMKREGMGHFNENSEAQTKVDTIIEITRWKSNSTEKTLPKQHQNKTQGKYKLVLLYTPVFGRMPWLGLKNTYDFIHPRGKVCEVSNCRLTYDKKDLTRSDAVVFHGRDLPSVNTMATISRNRSWKQRWIFYIQENPHNTFVNTKTYDGFFNWTMTYRRDSDIFVPYNYYGPLNAPEKVKSREKLLKDYAEGKDKLIAWMVSHCGTLRDKVVTKLLEYANVTVFGKCGKHFNQTNRCDRRSTECDKLLKSFKFYLSFENANCIDYVTEKYWYTPFLHDMVPIVLGPLKYDSKIAIPGSYINVMDFPSLEALASYLKYLDKNDTAYNEYFQWKLKYKIDYPNPWHCQMCADLNNPDLPVKVYDDLGGYWDKKNSCGEYEDKVRELLLK